ncbi:hypothetical protein EFL69_09135, partial [Weissella confusa]|uniref:hypothetical protein n=1 Tax=Weissella confusa TaxID=1583 RepID=UPI00223C4A0A
MQVQLDLDLFTGGTDLVVPMQYYSAKYFDDKGLMKKSFAVSVDSRNELRKGAALMLDLRTDFSLPCKLIAEEHFLYDSIFT